MRVKANETLDLKGLKCPLPALFAKRALLRAAKGSILEVVSDDPLAAIDLPHMCRGENFEVLRQTRNGNVVKLWLRRP
jgi:tRNA 2-thiouridine synthesizing protein A